MIPDDQQIDQRLRDWRGGLDCDDAVKQRMLTQILQQAEVAVDNGDPITSNAPIVLLRLPFGRNRRLAWASSIVAAGVAGIIAWALWPDRLPQHESIAQTPSPVAPLDPFRFTSDELHRTRRLVCELDRVFENQLQLIHLHNRQLDFDISNHPVADSASARVVLRFVLQQRDSGNDWTTLQNEEVIGGQDHQFQISESTGMTVQYWSHVLPDNSLWAEISMSADATSAAEVANVATCEVRCLANQPTVVWNHSVNDRQMQLLLIYELLNPCGEGVI